MTTFPFSAYEMFQLRKSEKRSNSRSSIRGRVRSPSSSLSSSPNGISKPRIVPIERMGNRRMFDPAENLIPDAHSWCKQPSA